MRAFLFLVFAGMIFATVPFTWAQDLVPDPSRTAIMPEERAAQKEAEEKKAPEESQKKKQESAKSDIGKATDKQLEEAQRFYKSCAKNENMNTAHDCRCLAGEYLAKRVALGNSVAAKEIYAKVRGLCIKDSDASEGGSGVGLGDEYTDKELEEAQEIYNQCMGDNSMKLNHDCRCMAARFLEKRKTEGRLAGGDHILVNLRNECRNGPDVAGHLYMDCIGKPEFLPIGITDPKKFCECYANDYAKEYEKFQGEINDGTRTQISMIVLGTCRNKQQEMGTGASQ